MKSKESEDNSAKTPAGAARQGAPEVYAISRGRAGWTLSRRNLVSAAAAAATIPRRAGGAVCPSASDVRAHSGVVKSVAISPDGRLLASGSADRSIKLWSLPQGALLKTLKGHTAEVNSIAVSPDGRLLASGSSDNSIRLWSLPDGAPLKTLSDHSGAVNSIAISPDGRLLASGSQDKSIKVWSLPDGTLRNDLTLHAGPVNSVAINPDGLILASASRDRINILALSDGNSVIDMDLFGGATALAFGPDGRLFRPGGWYRRGDLVATTGTLRGWGGNGLAVSPDGRLVLSSSGVWSVPDGARLASLGGTGGVAISPDGRLAVTGHYSAGISLWSLPDGKQLPVCLMDPAESDRNYSAKTYAKDGGTYTVPCDTPMPTGAVCTCNCVPGACSCVVYSPPCPFYVYPN